jgi:hypothetical protein
VPNKFTNFNPRRKTRRHFVNTPRRRKEIEDRFAMSSFLENLTIVVFVEEAKKGKDGIDEDVKGLEKERQVSMVKMNAVD